MNELRLIDNDPWLKPFEQAIAGRHSDYLKRYDELTSNGEISLQDFASGHNYFGLHRRKLGWVFRERAPFATEIYLIGDFNNWRKENSFKLTPLDDTKNVWELKLPLHTIKHGQLYKLLICWPGGEDERIPAWCTRVVQDPETGIFSAQVWNPECPYKFKKKKFKPKTDPLIIYECHIGMATEEEKVGSYNEFRINILPRIKEYGYNAIQIMAIQEHPYYGSFGYHVSSFFAPSSRFGTPEELKQLIDEAHEMGIAVIMDIVHAHAVKNQREGLALFDGSRSLYFHEGERGEHPAWDSLCFNYGKNEVLHFLLSNCKYWMTEFNFDGFRFDGVTSMLYYSHGLGENFCSYEDYYNGHQDTDAITYLTLANKLIHSINPYAITIAEEVSGMPGLAAPIEYGGYGFNYRMAMNIPDFWIKYIKEVKDEDWKPSAIWWETTNRRADEKTISYCESHDQALVGDKTIIFRLIDSDMYWHMMRDDQKGTVMRGLALHKMIRLITAVTINGGYLNFMGNEFGHPEWIDFPREGNNWSYKYARRQWSLVDNPNLKYQFLANFDKAMLTLIESQPKFEKLPIQKLWEHDEEQTLVFKRGNFIFIFNFNPIQSYYNYKFNAPIGEYEVILNTDDKEFGGFGFNDDSIHHFTKPNSEIANVNYGELTIYIPARSAIVLKKLSS